MYFGQMDPINVLADFHKKKRLSQVFLVRRSQLSYLIDYWFVYTCFAQTYFEFTIKENFLFNQSASMVRHWLE